MVKNFVDKFKIGLVEPEIGLNNFADRTIIKPITYEKENIIFDRSANFYW